MVAFEFCFYLFWEILELDSYSIRDLMISENSNLLFYDALILPYLLICR